LFEELLRRLPEMASMLINFAGYYIDVIRKFPLFHAIFCNKN
jgi:hypothetical protein